MYLKEIRCINKEVTIPYHALLANRNSTCAPENASNPFCRNAGRPYMVKPFISSSRSFGAFNPEYKISSGDVEIERWH